MALGAQLPVRLDLDVEMRLESIAQRTGTTKSALIRMLSKRFVDTCVSEDGTVNLPPNIQAMLQDRDNRSSEKHPLRHSDPMKEHPHRRERLSSKGRARAAAVVRGALAASKIDPESQKR